MKKSYEKEQERIKQKNKQKIKMQGKPEEQIEELEKMIISAEIEKVAHPYNKSECDNSIKQCYHEISRITKDSERKVRKRNVALAAALTIVMLFGFTLTYLNLAPGNTDSASDVTGFAFYTGHASDLLKAPINESLSPLLSSISSAVGEEFAKQNEIVKEEVEKKQEADRSETSRPVLSIKKS